MRKVHLVSGRVECPESLHLAACLERFFVADGCERVASRDDADLVVLNGCERIAGTPEVVAGYRELARARPEKTVLVVGCVPAREAEGAPANFFLVPFSKLVRDPSLVGPAMGFSRPFALLRKDDVFFGRFPVEERYPGDPPPTEVALLAIGTGCRGRCSYCTIRRGRGTVRSLPLDEILAEARSAVAAGRFRFVLLADDAGCWGHDRGLSLPALLAELVALAPNARFLVRPMNPAHLPGMIDALAPFLDRLDYLYLPVQSGSDRVLSLMQRGYGIEEIRRLVRRLREGSPGITLKTDLIVGFPTETRADFRASLRAARLFDHASFHRFVAYPGTPAAALAGAVPDEEVRLRVEVARRRGHTIVDPSAYAYDDGTAVPAVARPRKVYSVTGNTECVNNVSLAASLERFVEAESCEWIDSAEEADVVLLNVCNVLEGTPALVERYRAFARENPGKQVLVLGCVPGGPAAATRETEPNFHVIGFGKLVRDPSLIGPRMGFSRGLTLLKAQEALADRLPEWRLPLPRSECCFVTIGSGCQGRCTYCSIRGGRGAARSVDPEEIVRDARAGLAAGRRRLVLVADDAGCWGRDLGLDLPHLLGRLTEACADVRFAVLDFNPVHLPAMFERLRPFLPRIDYLYAPLQSGSDRILALMQRGYRAGDVMPLLRRIREEHPDVVLETDFIVGFPGETAAEFDESLHAAQAFELATFVPFVPKADTPAAAFPGRIDAGEMARRMSEARRLHHKVIDPVAGGGARVVSSKVALPEVRREPRPDRRPAAHPSAPVLVKPRQKCLAPYDALNVTGGCAVECLWCDSAFAGRDESGRVEARPRLAEELALELDARPPPALVLFCPDCDPFAPGERGLDVVHDAMALLLRRGVQLLVETRAAVPPRFLELFARHPEMVKVQLGLSTVDDRARALMEPRGATVADRLASLAALVGRGVATEIDLGPLVPELDDGDAALGALCAAVVRTGVRSGTVSFLEVTGRTRARLEPLALGAWSFADMAARLYPGAAGDGGAVRAAGEHRERRFRSLAAIASEHGLRLALCRCNNPDRALPAPDHGLLRRPSIGSTRHDAPARGASPLAQAPGDPDAPFTPEQRVTLAPLLERLSRSATARVRASPEGLVLEFPDARGASGRGRVMIEPWAPGRPCYRRVGTLAMSYSGELTPATAQAMASVGRWLQPAARDGEPGRER